MLWQDMPRPFAKLKALDIDDLAEQVRMRMCVPVCPCVRMYRACVCVRHC